MTDITETTKCQTRDRSEQTEQTEKTLVKLTTCNNERGNKENAVKGHYFCDVNAKPHTMMDQVIMFEGLTVLCVFSQSCVLSLQQC